MSNLLKSLKMLLLMTILTGILYPLFILYVANMMFPYLSRGDLIYQNEKVVGSKIIGQNFTQDHYFWGRPSAVNYQPLPAGASQLGPTSLKLKNQIQERRQKLAAANDIKDVSLVPIELMCASASGVDPDISIDAALFQLDRVAKARGLNTTNDQFKIKELILANEERPVGKFFGFSHVNVLILNLALDELEKELKNKIKNEIKNSNPKSQQ